jgi:hypothetical protein
VSGEKGDQGNGKWVLRVRNVAIPETRRKLRRVNPRSAAGMKQGRQGLAGKKTPGG